MRRQISLARPPARVGQQIVGHVGVQLGDDDGMDERRCGGAGGRSDGIRADLDGGLHVGDRFRSQMAVWIIRRQAFGGRGLEQAIVSAQEDQAAFSCVQELAISRQGSRKMNRVRGPKWITLDALACVLDGCLTDRRKPIEILPIFGKQGANLVVFGSIDRMLPQSSGKGAPHLDSQQMGCHDHRWARRNQRSCSQPLPISCT